MSLSCKQCGLDFVPGAMGRTFCSRPCYDEFVAGHRRQPQEPAEPTPKPVEEPKIMNKKTDVSYQRDLRDRVEAAISRTGISVNDLAEIVGCHWSSVYNFLRNAKKTRNFEGFENWLSSLDKTREQTPTARKEAAMLVVQDESIPEDFQGWPNLTWSHVPPASPEKTPYEAVIEEILGKEARASLERLVSPELAARMRITVGLEWAEA